MRRLSDVAGTRVMSRASAERVGKLERVVFDQPPRRIVAIQVAKRLVDWSAVHGLGVDAVVIEDDDRLRAASGAREDQATAGAFDWKAKRVLSDRGNEMGVVTDVEVDETSGAVEVVETTGGRVGADRLLAIGSYCLVVRHEAGAEPPG